RDILLQGVETEDEPDHGVCNDQLLVRPRSGDGFHVLHAGWRTRGDLLVLVIMENGCWRWSRVAAIPASATGLVDWRNDDLRSDGSPNYQGHIFSVAVIKFGCVKGVGRGR